MNESDLNKTPDNIQEHTSVKEVLLVDDEEPFLLSLADALSIYKKYFNIHTAMNGSEAVNILKTAPVIDLVVTSLGMPKTDGFELVAHMNKSYPGIPVIVTTAFDTPKLKEVMYGMGIFHYMEKPLDITLFRLGHKRCYSPSLTYVFIEELVENIFKGLGTKPVKLNPMQVQMKISGKQKEEILKKINSANDLQKTLYDLAHSFKSQGSYGEAIFCYRELLERFADTQADVTYLFALGQIMEKMHDYDNAVSYYQEAFKLCDVISDTSYWINNNLGFSLCMLKRFHEAEKYCRLAIGMNSGRLNAFKNLGLSLEGQGKLREAIDAYITAIKIDAKDLRAMNLFEIILDKHPELKEEYNERLEECRNMVEKSYQYRKPKQLQ
jgi:CheY-like chemotaxis protein